jgi:hypothetical protein
VRIRFHHHGLPGVIAVRVEPNDEPDSLGCGPENRGLPACTATVTYPGGGYQAMFGWIQLVRSSDATTDGFEMDPFVLFPDADSPYCFYGHAPTLFDGPGRDHRQDMTWLAHSFLAATPLEPPGRRVTPLAGFSWGFGIRAGAVALRGPAALSATDWRSHLDYLRASYPGWRFADGWSDRPPGRLTGETPGRPAGNPPASPTGRR